MPSALVKRYAEQAKKTVQAVEKIWDEAKAAAAKKFKPGPRYWAYVNGTVRKRLGIVESMTFKEYIDLSQLEPTIAQPEVAQVPQYQQENEDFARYLGCLFAARDKAHELHLAAKSHADHVALNELYDLLLDHADKMTESYQGKHGLVNLSIPATDDIFCQTCPREFAAALAGWLETTAIAWIGDDAYVINQYEELLGDIYQIKYKLDNFA